jgi:CBS domain-containing protein
MILVVLKDVLIKSFLIRRKNRGNKVQENKLLVRDLMTTEPVCVSADLPILKAVSKLLRHEISSALVVNSKHDLVGILTERDCIQVVINSSYFNEISGKVSDYMSGHLETVSPEESLIEIAEKYIKSAHRRFPVIENNRLVGLISRRDLLRSLEF